MVLVKVILNIFKKSKHRKINSNNDIFASGYVFKLDSEGDEIWWRKKSRKNKP